MEDQGTSSLSSEANISDDIKSKEETWLDNHFEPVLFQLRLTLIIPVIVSFLGAIVMFILGFIHTYFALFELVVNNQYGSDKVMLPIIKALDSFLIGIVLIIFSFGVYDFFISRMDPADYAGIRPDWFKFESTGELKNKLIEVVMVILTIKFFELIIGQSDTFTDPKNYLIIPIGAAIFALSMGFFKWATE